jgi:hypothetical protein
VRAGARREEGDAVVRAPVAIIARREEGTTVVRAAVASVGGGGLPGRGTGELAPNGWGWMGRRDEWIAMSGMDKKRRVY